MKKNRAVRRLTEALPRRGINMSTVNICETFTSIQGESSYAGLSCFFIRLSGCNLRCKYCDTVYAYKSGKDVAVGKLVEKAVASGAALIEITGGEPLLQPGFRDLAVALRDKTGGKVFVETNGSLDISVIPDNVIAVMDIKCPASGESGKMDLSNIGRMRPYDEVKFVLSNRGDYDWAVKLVKRYKLTYVCNSVFFSPVYGVLDAKKLGKWILKDKQGVRLGVQLHKVIGVK